MLLTKAQVRHFRSIDESGPVEIDRNITVLVGQNESGKTAFLHALALSWPVKGTTAFNIDRDYPRKGLNDYRKQHEVKPAVVSELTFQLTDGEVAGINKALGTKLLAGLSFSLHHHYKNSRTVILDVDEAAYVKHLVKSSGLPLDAQSACGPQPKVRKLIEKLKTMDLNEEGKEFLAVLTKRFNPDADTWHDLLQYEVWHKHLSPLVPKFFYFDDYYLLPGKVNLPSLAQRAANPDQLTPEDQSVMSLFQLAGVEMKELTDSQGYEQIKSRLEGLSISITDTIFKYWTQNQELDVEFDIRSDPTDQAPFNSGPNLYIRIKNRRHRVSVPFSQRSKGFIWFFSFIVWFDTIQRQLGPNQPLVLLLDEPGLSLHALAQGDFLRYIDDLAESHQILYTTHSPFMIHGDRLHQVRLVEDRKTVGTVVTSNLTGSDPKTLFPLQAALGYTVAQNLFISKRNLLVEGPGDLVYLRFFSSALESAGRTGLRDDITVVPTGGLDKLATFIALLGANQLDMVVVHDWAAKPDPHLDSLVRDKVIKDKLVLNYGLFRGAAAKAKPPASPVPPPPATDVEDLFAVPFYLKHFNDTFEKQLGGEVKEADLPPGDRIIDRLNRHLKAKSVSLRPSGGFNHYAVANYLAAHPPKAVDKDTLSRFEALFAKVNSLVGPPDE